MNLRYRISKVVYIVLLEISLPVDVALGIRLYDYLGNVCPNDTFFTLAILLLSGILGAVLYIIYLYQLEFLTKYKKG